MVFGLRSPRSHGYGLPDDKKERMAIAIKAHMEMLRARER